MKCQRKRSPKRSCLAARSWSRFSPTTSTPASARAPSSSRSAYFVATTIVTPAPDLLADARVVLRGSRSADIGNDALPSRAAVVAAVGEEELRLARGAVARCARPVATPASRSARSAAPPRSSLPVRDDFRRRSARGTAPRPPRRPRSSMGRCPGPTAAATGPSPSAATPDSTMPVEQAAPADVENARAGRSRREPRERDGQAVGRDERHRLTGPVGPEPVALARTSSARRSRAAAPP